MVAKEPSVVYYDGTRYNRKGAGGSYLISRFLKTLRKGFVLHQ